VIDDIRTQDESVSLEEIEFEGIHTEDHERHIDSKSKLEEVLTFMETFSERDRMILIYRIWEDLSYEDISQITGESVSNCKKIVSRSLAKISANVSYLFYLSNLLHYVS
jgi:RNA polymerase sigma factor (sigma-70 family)